MRPGDLARGIAGLALLGALAGADPRALVAQDLKTIRPGMTEAEVRIAWGDPFTVKQAGVMSYLYYRNDCLERCGTYDVVFLEKGQVIDAVVRDSQRHYDGIASSPVDRKPVMTRP